MPRSFALYRCCKFRLDPLALVFCAISTQKGNEDPTIQMVKSEKLCQDYLLVKIKSICWERQCGMFKMYIWSFSENLAKMGANLLWRM